MTISSKASPVSPIWSRGRDREDLGGAIPMTGSPFDAIGGDDASLERLGYRRGVKWQRTPGAIAAWVADMDIPPAGIIRRRLHELIGRGDVGYPHWPPPRGSTPVRDAFMTRARDRWGWEIGDRSEIVELCDVVQGIQLVLYLATQPGDGVIVHTPTYPPMLDAIEQAGCRRIDLPAHISGSGNDRTVSFDLDELDSRLEGAGARVLLLCHPHNPTGRVFDREELTALADLARRHDLVIISDEIHADLTYEQRSHLPMAALDADAAARTVTLNSPSKMFNLAGLRYAVAHIGPAELRERLAQLPDHLLGAANLAGVTGALAAWTEPEAQDWADAVLVHLDAQRHHLADLLATHLPEVGYSVPEATYLGWLDCRALDLGADPSEYWRREDRGRYRVDLSPGPDFGPGGDGFVRLNFATSAAMLERIVTAMAHR